MMWLLYHIQEDHHVKMTEYDFGNFIQMAAEKQKRQEIPRALFSPYLWQIR